jgi:hypothetical protein
MFETQTMNKRTGFLLVVLIAAGVLAATAFAAMAQLGQRGLFQPIPESFMPRPEMKADTAAEFYFTRLVYSENGWRRRPTMRKPPFEYACPEFGGGKFFPPQGWGWATDFPGADCKFMGGVHRLTGARVHPNPNVMTIMDPRLFDFPFAYAVEVGGMELSGEEAARLREYLLRGGYLFADDFWGGWQKENFVNQMRKVFPDRELEELPLTHPVFHTFYDLDGVMQIPNVGQGCYGGPTWQEPDDREPRIYGMHDDAGRLMVVVTYNSDLGDAWEYMDLPCYPEAFSGWAYRAGVNFMIYSMTH